MIPKYKILRFFLFILLGMAALNIQARKTYIVCVGLNVNRDNIDPLPTCRGDMQSIANFFHNYNDSEVFMLVDSNATRDHILKVLERQFSKSSPEDEIIFAYSGHGFDGGVSTYNNEEVLYCSEVQKIMLNSKARRKLMFINSCHSGSFTKKYGNTRDPRRNYDKKSNVMLFLSSTDKESSWTAARGWDTSFFFYYLVEGLKGRADKNRDKKVTARELFNYVAPQVTEITDNQQHPVMWGRFDDDMIIVNVP